MTHKEIEKAVCDCKTAITTLDKYLHDTRCMIRELAKNKDFVSQDEFYSKTIRKALAFEILAKKIPTSLLMMMLENSITFVSKDDIELVYNQIKEVKNNE